MSGIAGIIHFDGAPADPDLIKKMTAAMSCRGPDGINHWVKGSVALGQCMLCTTPESLEETQPWANEDESLVLVMDGRVDNWEELRKELLGYGVVLRNHSDAELVLRAYEVWRDTCLDRIIGEFVFFIWDSRQHRLFGARDAAGTRHFYYHSSKGWFGFASEINGLLATERIEQRLNEPRLLDYLVVEFDRDDEVSTFCQNISRLPAGHAMQASAHAVKTWRNWHPEALSVRHFKSIDEYAEAFLDQLRIAVRCRLRSIGPVGAMLSGGVDSSSIVGLIRKEFRDDLKQPLRTYSLIRQDRDLCPDWQHIQLMLEEGWIEPTILTSAIAAEIPIPYSDYIRSLNEPFTLPGGFLDNLVFNAARSDGCRVVLDGMAGDLLFYRPEHSLVCALERGLLGRIPGIIAAFRRHSIEGSFQSLLWFTLRAVTPERLRAYYTKLREKHAWKSNSHNQIPGDLLSFFHRDIANQYLAMRYSQRRQLRQRACRGSDQHAHASNFTTGAISFAHEVNGQLALSNGVEPRSPLSDRRIIEFAIQMPLEMKLAAPWYKFLMRKSMKGILPEAVRWRREMGGHPGWEFYDQHIAEIARSAPETWNLPLENDILSQWIDCLQVQREYDKYKLSGDYVAGFQLYTLSVLIQWLKSRPNLIKRMD